MNTFNQTAHKAEILVPVCWGLQLCILQSSTPLDKQTKLKLKSGHTETFRYTHICMGANVHAQTHKYSEAAEPIHVSITVATVTPSAC